VHNNSVSSLPEFGGLRNPDSTSEFEVIHNFTRI
jgi:hypothetical protein